MPFRYFIKNLLLPPGIFLLLLLIAWWLRHARPRLSRALFVIGLAGMWAMSLPIVVQWSAKGSRTSRLCRRTSGRHWHNAPMPS
jgi:hypothetical protein